MKTKQESPKLADRVVWSTQVGEQPMVTDIQDDNGPIKELGVCYEGAMYLRGLRIKFVNGKIVERGHYNAAAAKTLEFKKDESITEVTFSVKKPEIYRVSHLEFVTSEGRKFSVGSPTEAKTVVQGGLLVGIKGRYGADIDGLSFGFLQGIKKIVLTGLKYRWEEAEILESNPQSVYHIDIDNTKGELDTTHTIGTTESVVDENSWTHSSGIKIHAKVEVVAGTPLPGVPPKVKWTVGAEASYQYTSGGKHTELKTWKVDSSIPVEKGKRVVVDVLVSRSKIDVPYDAEMTIIYADGEEKSFSVRKTYEGLTSHDVRVTIDGNRKAEMIPQLMLKRPS